MKKEVNTINSKIWDPKSLDTETKRGGGLDKVQRFVTRYFIELMETYDLFMKDLIKEMY